MAMNEISAKANIKSGLLAMSDAIKAAADAGEVQVGGVDFDAYWAGELANIITAEMATMVRSGSVSTNVSTNVSVVSVSAVTPGPGVSGPGAGSGTGSGSGTLS